MGLFVHFQGRFECVRCRRMSEARIQTKLLRHEADNCSRSYRVGDCELLVGLDDYCPLHPWEGRSPLIIAVGDWDCGNCGLNWQWAKVVFEVKSAGDRWAATIRDLSGLQPHGAAELAGVQFVESDLAELSGLWERPTPVDWRQRFLRWQGCSVAERCERVAAGFRSWCREVARVDSCGEPVAAPDRPRD